MRPGRRRFLKGLGGVTVGLPMLAAFEKNANAQMMPTAAKRAVFFWTPNGFNLNTFYPRTRFNNGQSAFGPLSANTFAARALDTSNEQINGVSRALFRHPEWGLRNLGGFMERVSVLRGLRNSRQGFVDLADGGDHGMETANRLTAAGIGGGRGLALGRSVDYAIADRINPTVAGQRLPLVLHVGTNADPRNGNGTSFISYRGSEDPDPGINNPWVAYRQLMNIVPGTPQESYLIKRKKRLADLVKAELTDLRNTISPGPKDRRILTDWLGLVEAVEDGMNNMGLMCTSDTLDSTITPSAVQMFQSRDNDALGRYEDFAAITDLMIKLIGLSMLCGSTNVATLQFSGGAGGPAFGQMGMRSEVAGPGTWWPGERHHELSHRNGSDGSDPGFLQDVERNMSWIDNWYGDRYRDLIALLDSFQLLDDSVVVWMPEFGDGRDHHFIEITAVLAGSAGGYLKTGSMFDCSSDGRWDQRLDEETNGPQINAANDPANVYSLDIGWIPGTTSHNKLLTTVYNAVLPRDTSGRPVNPINRFPENDTADGHNLLEDGELTPILA